MSNSEVKLPHIFASHVEAWVKEYTPEKLRRLLRNQIEIAPAHTYELIRTNRDEEVLQALNLIVEWRERMQLVTDILQRYPNELIGMGREIPNFVGEGIAAEFIARSTTIFFAAEKTAPDITTVKRNYPQQLAEEISISQKVFIK